jgi:hypothetical protein
MAVLVLVAIAPFGTRLAFTQQVSGTITGYVTDPSGGAVPGATVTATNVQTGVSTSHPTEASGLYILTNMIAGTYNVSVEAHGFKKFQRQNVELNVDATIDVDAHLELGDVTQEVTVSGAPPVLNMEKSDVSDTISSEAVEDLPTISRNVSSLVNPWSNTKQLPARGFRITG